MIEQVFINAKNGIRKAVGNLPMESKPLVTFVVTVYSVGVFQAMRKSHSPELRHHAASYMNEFHD
ncbi:unnamed protein product [Cunninghamella blakesleeana]